ncbi:MAG: ABC transporter permease [bacterium]
MWRPFIGLVVKEFRHVFRDANMLKLIFAMPLMQLIIFGYVANTEVRQIALDVYDFDRGRMSREFVGAMQAGDYFIADEPATDVNDLDSRFTTGRAEMALLIPPDFSESIRQRKQVTVGLIADGSNANSATIGLGYAAQMARKFSQDKTGLRPPIDIRRQVLYNPEAESVYFMVPGIVASLLLMLSVMLTSMALIREREAGTLEQLLVTPISKLTLLLGKIAPFAVLGLFEMMVVLTVGVLWFSVPFVGSPFLLTGLAAVYLLAALGVGLFISTVTTSQQQAMFFAWFFSIFAMLTSGFFTPIANMPDWLQYITCINPMRFFLSIARGIMMKGSGFADLWRDIAAQTVYAVVIFTFATLRFSKR